MLIKKYLCFYSLWWNWYVQSQAMYNPRRHSLSLVSRRYWWQTVLQDIYTWN